MNKLSITKLFFAISVIAFFFISAQPRPAYALDVTYDFADSNNYNLRIDGGAADNNIPYGGTVVADIDGNGKNDLLVGTPYRNGNSGALYLILDSILEDHLASGTPITLSDSNDFTLRFDGESGAYLTNYIRGIVVADLDNNGENDIIFTSPYADYPGRTDSGYMYIIYDSLIPTLLAGSQTVAMSDAGSYSLRLVGSGANFTLGCGTSAVVADIDNNGLNDIVIGEDETSRDGKDYVGSFYVILDSMVASYGAGPSTTIDLAVLTNFNIRYDGSGSATETYGQMPNGLHYLVDLNNDDKLDFIIPSRSRSIAGRLSAGAMYILYNDTVMSHNGIGQIVQIGNPSNYDIEIFGEYQMDNLGFFTTALGDIDNDTIPDLLVGSPYGDRGALSDVGFEYYISGAFLNSQTTPGAFLDLRDSDNYIARFQGIDASDRLGFSPVISDINFDGVNEVLLGNSYHDEGGFVDSGVLYYIPNDVFQNIDPASKDLIMSDTSLYQIAFQGATGDALTNGSINIGDINSDGRNDILVGAKLADPNGVANAGSLYIFLNYPHTITLDPVAAETDDDTVTITGSISALSSISNIEGMQYSIVFNGVPSGIWNDCTTEYPLGGYKQATFTCTLSNLDAGDYSITFRSYDNGGFFTRSQDYADVVFTVNSPDDLINTGTETSFLASLGFLLVILSSKKKSPKKY